MFSAPREWSRHRTAHGSISIMFRRSRKSVLVRRMSLARSVSSEQSLMKRLLKNCLRENKEVNRKTGEQKTEEQENKRTDQRKA